MVSQDHSSPGTELTNSFGTVPEGRKMEYSSRHCTQIHRIKADWQRTSSVKKLDWAARRPSVSNLDSVGLSLSSKIYIQKK